MKNLKEFIISLWDEDMEILLAALLICVLVFGLWIGSSVQQKTEAQRVRVIYDQDRN